MDFEFKASYEDEKVMVKCKITPNFKTKIAEFDCEAMQCKGTKCDSAKLCFGVESGVDVPFEEILNKFEFGKK